MKAKNHKGEELRRKGRQSGAGSKSQIREPREFYLSHYRPFKPLSKECTARSPFDPPAKEDKRFIIQYNLTILQSLKVLTQASWCGSVG